MIVIACFWVCVPSINFFDLNILEEAGIKEF